MERKILVAIGKTGLDKTTIDYLVNLLQERKDVRLHLLNVVPLYGVSESQQLLGDTEAIAVSRPESLKKRRAAK
ncbi:MAG: hypothetical protein P8130_01555, partial [Deltaproteobacteria bacterium]